MPHGRSVPRDGDVFPAGESGKRSVQIKDLAAKNADKVKAGALNMYLKIEGSEKGDVRK